MRVQQVQYFVMETDSKLPADNTVTDRKVVTTRTGDQGRTSLGMHGFVGKDDARIELMGGLDLLRTLSHTLPTRPPWIADMITDMMVALVKVQDLRHDERLQLLDESITTLRAGVTFSNTGWFTPTSETSCK
ncbi:MAG: ATP:cob(I)alamin adenosyltransferase, partial [Nanoarchaeota archaeon]